MCETITVILIRHGETLANKRGMYLGCRSDVELSCEGENCALEKKDYLNSLISGEFQLICSPLKRCTRTASIVFPQKEFKTLDSLMEIDFGEYEGLTYEDLKDNAYYRNVLDSDGKLPFPEGESRAEYIQRTLSGFEQVLSDNQSSVIVAHGGTIMAVLSALTEESYFSFQVKNLEGYKLELTKDNGKISVVSYSRI